MLERGIKNCNGSLNFEKAGFFDVFGGWSKVQVCRNRFLLPMSTFVFDKFAVFSPFSPVYFSLNVLTGRGFSLFKKQR